MISLKPGDKFIKGKSIFLAGSIDLGLAGDWQKWFEDNLDETDLIVFNPRIKQWDSEWYKEEGRLEQLTNWELDAFELADLIVMYLDPEVKSPISLLELGLNARSKKIIVCCPEGFWRKGNIDIVCKRFGIKQVNNLEDLLQEAKNFLVLNPYHECPECHMKTLEVTAHCATCINCGYSLCGI
jgi:hypothetical protein